MGKSIRAQVGLPADGRQVDFALEHVPELVVVPDSNHFFREFGILTVTVSRLFQVLSAHFFLSQRFGFANHT